MKPTIMFLSILILLIPELLFGQSQLWSELDLRPEARMSEEFGRYKTFALNEAQMSKMLAAAPEEFTKHVKDLKLNLPIGNGELESFYIYHSTIMEDGLAKKFPHIKTYLIQGIDDPNKVGRLSWTNNGLKAYIWSWEDTYYVERIDDDKSGTYRQYKRSEMKDIYDRVCLVEGHNHDVEQAVHSRVSRRTMGDKLRTYRLAVATTGEYSQFHGGTVEKTIEAIVESVTRLNGIYERECAIRFILVENNDLIVNLDADSDPFLDGNASQMLGAAASFITSEIGLSNYDIGHVFATDGAGLASIRSVCKPNKAEGITGIFPPQGTAYVVEYLAHEIGHQFGAHHSFNKCPGNEVPNFAFEPGSGSTIMSYAGLCGSNNVESGSSDYFHVGSLAQIDAFTAGSGGTCAVDIETGNTPPEVQVPEGGFYIPTNTPFELRGEGFDVDDDNLTYCWEQVDLGPSSDLGSPIGSAPLFRSYKPTVVPNRIFPRNNLILNNATINTEVLPKITRDLTFRLTVRDNKSGSGGSAWDDMAFKSTSTAGPFVVTSQESSDEVWIAGTTAIVTWDVAGTDDDLVNCQEVDIYLSRAHGHIFDIVLAENVPNNGQATINVPVGLESSFARVKVKASNNIFFNVSKAKFKILLEPLSSKEVEESDAVKIYPNPATDFLFVNLEEIADYEESTISLFAADGKLMIDMENTSANPTLDVTGIPRGVYILQIETAEAVLTKKVIVQSAN